MASHAPRRRRIIMRGNVAARERSRPVLTFDDTLRHAAGMPAGSDPRQYVPNSQQPLNPMQVERLQTRQMHRQMHARALRDEQQWHEEAAAQRFTRKSTEEILREEQRAERAAAQERRDRAAEAKAREEAEAKAEKMRHQDQYRAMLERRHGREQDQQVHPSLPPSQQQQQQQQQQHYHQQHQHTQKHPLGTRGGSPGPTSRFDTSRYEMSPAREYELRRAEEHATYQQQQVERQRTLEARTAHLSPQVSVHHATPTPPPTCQAHDVLCS